MTSAAVESPPSGADPTEPEPPCAESSCAESATSARTGRRAERRRARPPVQKAAAQHTAFDAEKDLARLQSVFGATVKRSDANLQLQLSLPVPSQIHAFAKRPLLCLLTLDAEYKRSGVVDASALRVSNHLAYVETYLVRKLQAAVSADAFQKHALAVSSPAYALFRALSHSLPDWTPSLDKLYRQHEAVEWTEAEEERLAQAVVWHKSFANSTVKWAKISEFVSTRSPADCYRHFCAYAELRAQSAPEAGTSEGGAPIAAAKAADASAATARPARARAAQTEPRVSFRTTCFAELSNVKNVGAVCARSCECSLKCHNCKKVATHRLQFGDAPGVPRKLLVACAYCVSKTQADVQSVLLTAENVPLFKLNAPNFGACFALVADVVLQCLNCNADVAATLRPESVCSANCPGCFAELSLKTQQFFFTGRCEANKTQKTDAAALALKPNSPLPKLGACKHYAKSQRWFIWQCCNVPFPCAKCHDAVSNHAADELANLMVCGHCSKIQSATVKECQCGKFGPAKRTAFWNGGKGCRDRTTLSRKDSRKHKR